MKFGRGKEDTPGVVIVARGSLSQLPYHIKGRYGQEFGQSLRNEKEFLTKRNTQFKVRRTQDITLRFSRKRGSDELIRDPEGDIVRKQRFVYVDLVEPERTDSGEKRLGKPCGESHIPKANKCTKGSGAGGKVALAVTGAAAVALFVKRKEAQSALTRAVLSAEKAVAGKKGRQTYEEVRNKIPEALRGQADKAVGTTKTALGVMANNAASPMKVVGINAKQGFVTGRFKKGGEFVSIGSVGRDVIEARTEKGRGNEWTVTFTVNSNLTRETPRSTTEARRIFNTARAMVKDQASRLPKGATLFAEGAVGDGSDRARNRIYKRWGFEDDGDGGLIMNASDF